jgi:hypothetical protein
MAKRSLLTFPKESFCVGVGVGQLNQIGACGRLASQRRVQGRRPRFEREWPAGGVYGDDTVTHQELGGDAGGDDRYNETQQKCSEHRTIYSFKNPGAIRQMRV